MTTTKSNALARQGCRTVRDSRGRFTDRQLAQCLRMLALAGFIVFWLLVSAYSRTQDQPLISPIPEAEAKTTFTSRIISEAEAEEFTRQAIPNMVEMAANKYAKDTKQRNHLVYQLHCLLKHESNYGENKGFGDGGRAGGILQFHEPTYARMRNQMIKSGEATEFGSRMSASNAIETTAWALANGRGNEWGPVKRGTCR